MAIGVTTFYVNWILHNLALNGKNFNELHWIFHNYQLLFYRKKVVWVLHAVL